MNAFNRIVMLIIALLLVAVPVLLLLVALGVISAGAIDQYTGYRVALDALGDLSVSDFDGRVRTIVAIVGALVALIALLLLLRELTFGRLVARNTALSDDPGAETLITARAVRTLAEAAAREAGAVSPSASLVSEGRPYTVFCRIQAPAQSNLTELATRARENIRRALESQNVPIKDVEVTVQGTAA